MKQPFMMLSSLLLACLVLMAGCGGPVYTLEVDGDIISDFTFADVEAAVRALTPSGESYVLLEPEIPIKNSLYLQVYLPYPGYDDGLGYYVEVCTRDIFDVHHYYVARTREIDDVLRCFSRYYKGRQLPNLNAWEETSWEDYGYYDDYGGYDYGYGYGDPAPQPGDV